MGPYGLRKNLHFSCESLVASGRAFVKYFFTATAMRDCMRSVVLICHLLWSLCGLLVCMCVVCLCVCVVCMCGLSVCMCGLSVCNVWSVCLCVCDRLTDLLCKDSHLSFWIYWPAC